MTRQEFRQMAAEGLVFLDGATGTNLQEAGMPAGVCPELWVLEHPEVMRHLQTAYLEAGSRILYAPTFSGNRVKLKEYGLADRLDEINRGLMQLTKSVIREFTARTGIRAYAAGDLTMTGQQLAPVGTMTFEELVDIYKEQVSSLAGAGADLFVVETMMSLNECRAALLAVRETVEDLPVMISLTFQEDGRTFYGTLPESAVLVLQAMGADAVGANCSTGPAAMCGVLRAMVKYAVVPVIAKPNAGMPVLAEGATRFELGARAFA